MPSAPDYCRICCSACPISWGRDTYHPRLQILHDLYLQPGLENGVQELMRGLQLWWQRLPAANEVEDLLAAYAPQLEEYARSWTAITGETVVSTGIFGVREGRLVTQ